MTENGLYVLVGPETQLHDILWAVHDGKTMVEARARKISGEFLVMVGGRGPSDARFSHTYACVCVALGSNRTRAIALATLLNPSD